MLFHFSTMSQEMLDFIVENHEGRVKTVTLREYKALPSRNVIICTKADSGGILSISASMIIGGRCKCSLTVTKIPERCKGHGTEVLQKKIDILHGMGIKYNTRIAADNIASLKMAEKSGLTTYDETTSLRKKKSEEYTVFLLGESDD